MGLFSKTPKAPDPYQTAASESQFNRLDTYSPSGSGTRYGYTDPATGHFVQGQAPRGAQSAVQSLESPWEKSIRQMLQPASQALVGNIVQNDVTNMPGPARVQDRGDVASAMFDRNLSMMMPGIDQSNSRLLTNLQARGLPIGGDAFNSAYGDQQRQTQDTISRLAQDSTVNAGQEQSRQFNLDSAARGNAMSEIVGAMTGNYNPPSAVPSGSAQPINYSGIAQQGYQNAVGQAQQKAQTMGSLGSLAGSMLMMCTQTAKSVEGPLADRFAASVIAQLPLAVWRYLPFAAPPGFGQERHVGPMAEHWHALTGLGTPDTISVIDALGITMGALKNALLRLEVLEVRQLGLGVH